MGMDLTSKFATQSSAFIKNKWKRPINLLKHGQGFVQCIYGGGAVFTAVTIIAVMFGK